MKLMGGGGYAIDGWGARKLIGRGAIKFTGWCV